MLFFETRLFLFPLSWVNAVRYPIPKGKQAARGPAAISPWQAGDETVDLKFPGAEKEREAKRLGFEFWFLRSEFPVMPSWHVNF